MSKVSVESPTTTIAAPRGAGGLSRHAFAAAVAAAALVGLALALAVVLGGKGHPAAHAHAHRSAASRVAGQAAGGTAAAGQAGHGTEGPAGRGSASGATAGAHAGPAHGATTASAHTLTGAKGAVAEVRDPEEAKSFPVSASVSAHHRAASTPHHAAEVAVAAGAASDAEIKRELRQEERAEAQERAARSQALATQAGPEGGSSVGGDGTIPIPANAPEVVQRVIAGGNAIADFPYIWGGGHDSFVDHGYDCSGSVSYALAAGGLLRAPLVSGDLANWGEPGPGRWITIYANAGHTFMNVDGYWFDTAGRSGPYASRWITATPSLAGYAVRHPPGY